MPFQLAVKFFTDVKDSTYHCKYGTLKLLIQQKMTTNITLEKAIVTIPISAQSRNQSCTVQ